MKFTVDIEEFWLEEEDDLSSALKSHISNTVVMKISKDIEGQVEKQITKKVAEAIDQKISPLIENKLTDLMATGIIVKNGSEISIDDYIKNKFQQNTGWNNQEEYIKKIAHAFGKEIKAQYNAAFANQVVVGMKEQGLLKDDVVQILLEGKS